MFLQGRSQHNSQQHWHNREFEFPHQESEQTKEEHGHNVKKGIAESVRSYYTENADDRQQYSLWYLKNLHPNPDGRQGEDEIKNVCRQEGSEHTVDKLGIILEEQGPGGQPLNHQGA